VIEITNANIEGLPAVCNELGFGSLSRRLRAFKDDPADEKVRVDALEQRVRRREVDVPDEVAVAMIAAVEVGSLQPPPPLQTP
jgi:hypothetical protein